MVGVIVVLVVSARPIAVKLPPPVSSIVTPELIVTLELSPVISKSVQLVEKILVLPFISSQSAAKTRYEQKQSISKIFLYALKL